MNLICLVTGGGFCFVVISICVVGEAICLVGEKICAAIRESKREPK